MQVIRAALNSHDSSLPVVPLRVERRQLAKRLWRGVADDGVAFGFELTAPLAHGDVVHATAAARYIIEQLPEPVLEIALEGADAAGAAVIGWAVGNMHFTIEARPGFIRAPDDPALRQSLARLAIPFREAVAIFQPHRFAAIVGHSHAAPTDHPFVRPPR